MEELRALAGGAPPSVSIEEACGGEPAHAAVFACAHRALASAARFDSDRLVEATRWAGQIARLSEPDRLVARGVDGLCVAFAGEGPPSGWAELSAEASRAGVPSLVVEARALAALAALREHRVEEAVAHARRAARMARAEAQVQQEYFASLVLARARRASGKPHLAARILTALAVVLPRAWAPWLGWELALSGAGPEDSPAATALRAALASARAGDRAALERALEALRDAAGGCAFARRDARVLAEAIDPSREPDAAASWCAGERARTLAPVEARWGAAADEPPVHVLVRPDEPARRLLASGLGLLGPEARRLEGAEGRPAARAVQLILTLARAGSALDEAAFEAVYGFSFVRHKHDGAFRVVIHRARAALESVAEIQRDSGRIALVTHTPFVVPEPGCARSLEERVMHLLGAAGARLGASEVADALGVNVRSAQRALRRLAEDGACEAERDGRLARYRLEDTSFLEPTRSRVRGPAPRASGRTDP